MNNDILYTDGGFIKLKEYLNVIGRIFDFCLENRVLTFNPSNYVSLPKTANKGKREPITLSEYCIPCWSLVALLDVLPGGYVIVKNYHSFYYVESRDHSKSTNIFDNPVDACVAMIEQLHKLNLL